MKALLLAIVATMLLAGCATVTPDCPPCPPENAIIFAPDPLGFVSPVVIPKDFFADKDNWVREKKFDEEVEKQKDVEQDKQGI